MANTIKYLDLNGLDRYDTLIKNYIESNYGDEVLKHTVTVNSGKKADGTTDITATSTSANSPSVTLADSGVTAGEYGPTANQTPTYGATFNVPNIKVNAKGIVTSVTNKTVLIPAANPDNDNTALTNGTTKVSKASGTGVTLTGGTGKFTVSDGTNSFDVTVGHGITNPVTGSGLTADTIILGNGNSGVKTSSKTIVTSLGDDNTTVPTSKAVSDAISGLSGAMHFIGTSTSEITDGGTQSPTITNYTGTAKTAGNVILYGNKEFVWTGSAWELFGDEGSYALKTVTVTGTGVLGGGGAISSNQTITHNTSGVHSSDSAQSYGPSSNVSGSNGNTIKVPQISVDKYGHITSVSERTYTSVDTTYTFDGTYNASTNKAATVSTVTNAINALDVPSTGTGAITGFGVGKTLATLTETNGKVAATFQDISITKSLVSDFPTLATVATSGSYNDLSNKPDIPTVNNGTLTIQGNSTPASTFTANQSSNTTLNIVGSNGITVAGATNTITVGISTITYGSGNSLDSNADIDKLFL